MIKQSQFGNYHTSSPQGTPAHYSPDDDKQRAAAIDAVLFSMRLKREREGKWTATGQQAEREFEAGSVGDCKVYHPWRRVYSEKADQK